jgi:hypothetical protein
LTSSSQPNGAGQTSENFSVEDRIDIDDAVGLETVHAVAIEQLGTDEHGSGDAISAVDDVVVGRPEEDETAGVETNAI